MSEEAAMTDWVEVEGYRLAADRAYDRDSHVWAQVIGPDRVRIGMDPLGVETSGTLAQVALLAAGTALERGEPLGTIEAEKFVGPLATPLSGTVAARNDAVMSDPGLVHRDPFGEGWLIELVPADLDVELARMVRGTDEISDWFAQEVADYRLKGVLAE